jgi:hypothetical protein
MLLVLVGRYSQNVFTTDWDCRLVTPGWSLKFHVEMAILKEENNERSEVCVENLHYIVVYTGGGGPGVA